MWQRFQEEARRSILLAQHEAQRLNHNTVDTEHMLHGLLQQPESRAVYLLQLGGIDLEALQQQLPLPPVGTDPSEEPHLTDCAKRVLEFAADESRRAGHHHIGTEHLLLGLLREKRGRASQVLSSLGLELEQARAWLLPDSSISIYFSTEAVTALSEAGQIAVSLQSTLIAPEHLLLALLDPRWRSAQLLQRAGVVPERVQLELSSLLKPGRGKPKDLRYNDLAAMVLRYAVEEARSFGKTLCGPEHILIALLRLPGAHSNPLLQLFRWLGLPIKTEAPRSPHIARRVLDEAGVSYHTLRLLLMELEGVPLANDWKTRFTRLGQQAIQGAQDVMWRTGSGEIAPAHLLMGLLQNPTVAEHWQERLQLTHLDWPAVTEKLKSCLTSDGITATSKIHFSSTSRKILSQASQFAKEHGHRHIGPEYLMLALLDSKLHDDRVLQVLRTLNVDVKSLRQLLGFVAPPRHKKWSFAWPQYRSWTKLQVCSFLVTWLFWTPGFLRLSQIRGGLNNPAIYFPLILVGIPLLVMFSGIFIILFSRSEKWKEAVYSFMSGFFCFVFFLFFIMRPLGLFD